MPLAMLDRLLRLQRGLPAPPPMLAPFAVDPRDMIDLQRAARAMAHHVGLGDLTFVVAVTTQPPDVAGHIEIKYAQREVFIEISDVLLRFPNAVLACLAHEVTHKYLHTHGIWLQDLLENERLTDTAAVFNGLGCIMLNGCEDESVEVHGEQQITHRFKGGYLERSALAEVYAATLTSRGAGRSLKLLNAEAAAEVKQAGRRLSSVLGRDRRSVEALADAVEVRVRDEQVLLSGAARDLQLLEGHLLPALKAELRARHAALRLNQDALRRLRGLEDGPEAILARAHARATKRDLDARCAGPARAVRSATRDAANVLADAPGIAIEATEEMFRKLVCGACGAKLRLPPGKQAVIARCPKCDYRFSADTTADGPTDPKRKGWRRLLGSS